MIPNAVTPYRVAFHVRLARELPEFRLLSLLTHDVSNSPWVLKCPPEINARFFGSGEGADTAPSSPLREWRKGATLIAFLEKHNARAVVLHGYNDMGRIRVLRWCHRKGIPCFLWGDSNARSDFATGLKRRVKATFLKYVLDRCNAVLVCGSLGKEFMVNYGADPSRVCYVPYEPDYEQIRAMPASAVEAVTEKFKLAPGRRRLIYSGRLTQVKRVDLLVDAFVAISAERPEWDLVIVGGGEDQEKLQHRIPDSLKSRVTWAGFQGDQAVVSSFYRAGDALCLPSEYEPWALVINEAVAAGLAVVASDVVGAAAELVRDGVNGKIFKSRDLSDLTAALRFVTDPDRIDALRAGSEGVLADWRRRGDPVEGVRDALRLAGLLPAAGTTK